MGGWEWRRIHKDVSFMFAPVALVWSAYCASFSKDCTRQGLMHSWIRLRLSKTIFREQFMTQNLILMCLFCDISIWMYPLGIYNMTTNDTPLAIYKRPRAAFWQSFMVTFVQSQSAFFLGGAYFPNCHKSSVMHVCWSPLAVSCHCMQVTISNQIDNQ